ncbi:glycosyltransferase, partial [Hydrogenophaga sp.]|uniref:glycosyltransferase n=1 Tax=Hydrogenophaga sp. TaxID=1904254 RepID=UPI0026295772
MRALPELLRARPSAHVLVVGEDGVSYGSLPKKHKNWRMYMLEEMGSKLDEAAAKRVHFLGRLDREAFTRVLQLSTVHVYLTYPFVLSWSLIEAMSVGCAIVASDTAPVQEVLKHEGNALLVDFFDHAFLVKQIESLLSNQRRREELSVAARRAAVEGFDLRKVCLPRQVELLESLCGKATLTPSRSHRSTPLPPTVGSGWVQRSR